ncbi:hypothetical protein [Pseudomonas sp. GL-R-19]|uniref:hypothetical protein n=1 Tax=Pseudomonas sp. GL-R-19 TaxID=2832391 RepID=UPI001CC094DB|nr:hypothetical protein [Pseudomonas sp. GL-R-19]
MTAELNVATVAASPWEQATLSINGKEVKRGAELVLLRGQANDVTVEAPPEIARELNLGQVENGGLTIEASPDFGDWVEPVNGQFNWKITPAAGKSGRITLVFFSREVDEAWEHRSLVISSNLADEADLLIDEKAVPPTGIDFYHGEPHIVSLRPKNNSPVAGLPVALKRSIIEGLKPEDLKCEPPFDQEQTEHRWAVTGLGGVGKFQLSLAGRGMTQALLAPVCKVLMINDSPNIYILYRGDEFLGNVQRMVVTRNVTYLVRFASHSSVPSTDLFAKLEWVSPPTGNVVEIEPALGVERHRPPGGKWDWNMKFLQSGEFSMRFFIRGGAYSASSILTILVQ